MKRTKINPISKKKQQQIIEEQKIRLILAERADGCCEMCGGNGFPFGLHPHEKIFRSQGGEMSLENSIVLCQACHAPKHGRIEIHNEVI
jgi:5-methylcytosine-specific restriction endonuclease McrA